MKKSSVGRKGYYRVKMDPEHAHFFDERLTDAMNHVVKERVGTSKNLTPHITANDEWKILEYGIQKVEELIEDEGEVSQATLLAREIYRIEREQARQDYIVRIYEDKGLDYLADFCARTEITDWEEIVKAHHSGVQKREKTDSWANQAEQFLLEFVAEGPQPIERIKTAAIATGLLDASNPHTLSLSWAKMSVKASRLDLSGHGERGWWSERVR